MVTTTFLVVSAALFLALVILLYCLPSAAKLVRRYPVPFIAGGAVVLLGLVGVFLIQTAAAQREQAQFRAELARQEAAAERAEALRQAARKAEEERQIELDRIEAEREQDRLKRLEEKRRHERELAARQQAEREKAAAEAAERARAEEAARLEAYRRAQERERVRSRLNEIDGEVRKWKRKDGSEIAAKFIEVDDGQAVLVREVDAIAFSVPLSKLSRRDRRLALRYQEEIDEANAPPRVRRPRQSYNRSGPTGVENFANWWNSQ